MVPGSTDATHALGRARRQPVYVRGQTIMQVPRIAVERPHGLTAQHSAGCLRDGCCSYESVRPQDAPLCRGLQDRGALGHHVPGRGVPVKITEGKGRDWPTPRKLSQRSKGDSSATGAERKATFGDTRRQLLGLRMGVGDGVSKCRRHATPAGDQAEDILTLRLTATIGEATATAAHNHALMDVEFQTGKGSIEATKNDKMQNPLDIRSFWRGHPIRITDSPEGRHRELVARVPHLGQVTLVVATVLPQTSSTRPMVAVTINERLPPPTSARRGDAHDAGRVRTLQRLNFAITFTRRCGPADPRAYFGGGDACWKMRSKGDES